MKERILGHQQKDPCCLTCLIIVDINPRSQSQVIMQTTEIAQAIDCYSICLDLPGDHLPSFHNKSLQDLFLILQKFQITIEIILLNSVCKSYLKTISKPLRKLINVMIILKKTFLFVSFIYQEYSSIVLGMTDASTYDLIDLPHCHNLIPLVSVDFTLISLSSHFLPLLISVLQTVHLFSL